MKKLVVIATLLALSVNAFAAGLARVSDVSVKQLLNASAADRTQVKAKSIITFSALSGGCTDVSNFSLDIKITATEQLVTILRNVEDTCEAVSDFQKMQLTTDKLEIADIAGKPVRIVNPVEVRFDWVR